MMSIGHELLHHDHILDLHTSLYDWLASVPRSPAAVTVSYTPADLLETTVISIKRWERNITTPGPYFRLKLTTLFGKSVEELGLVKGDTPATPILETEDATSIAESSASKPLVLPEKEGNLPTRSTSEQEVPAPARKILREQHQARMIERVSTMWITGVLEQSLHGGALQVLELYEQPHVVNHPWRFAMQEMQRPEQLLPAAEKELSEISQP